MQIFKLGRGNALPFPCSHILVGIHNNWNQGYGFLTKMDCYTGVPLLQLASWFFFFFRGGSSTPWHNMSEQSVVFESRQSNGGVERAGIKKRKALKTDAIKCAKIGNFLLKHGHGMWQQTRALIWVRKHVKCCLQTTIQDYNQVNVCASARNSPAAPGEINATFSAVAMDFSADWCALHGNDRGSSLGARAAAIWLWTSFMKLLLHVSLHFNVQWSLPQHRKKFSTTTVPPQVKRWNCSKKALVCLKKKSVNVSRRS